MEELLRNRKSGWEEISEEEKEKIFKFTDEYIEFMNSAKTEREIVKKTEEIVRKNGFKSLEEYSELYPGDKVYYINREKKYLYSSNRRRELRRWHKHCRGTCRFT